MEATRSFIKFHDFSTSKLEDFQFDHTTDSDNLLHELVPNTDQWGGINWIEFEEFEYGERNEEMNLILQTKWEPPTRWLQQASHNSPHFENKLITMTPIQKDETRVTGVAIMDGEILQNKTIFEMDSEEVAKYYEEEEGYDLDLLDNQIWDSIDSFVTVCKKFYLGEKDED